MSHSSDKCGICGSDDVTIADGWTDIDEERGLDYDVEVGGVCNDCGAGYHHPKHYWPRDSQETGYVMPDLGTWSPPEPKDEFDDA